MDNRQTLYIDFTASEDKALAIDGTIAQNEDFDVVFTGKTFPGEVSVALWSSGERKLLWYATGTAETMEVGCALRKLRASTQELLEYFEHGDAFMRALLTVGSHPEDGEWQDYGVGYVRLYVGTNPEEAPPPANKDIYPTEEELAKWLQEAAVTAAKVTEGAAQAEQASQRASTAAEVAQSSSQTAQRMAQEATSAKSAAAESASRASQSANSAGQFSIRASDYANKAKKSAENAEEYELKAEGIKSDVSLLAQQAAGARTKAEAAQKAAETAAGNAQAAAKAAGQKADEANQAAETATSASTSAEAAKTAAETAKTQAEAARDAANTAKTGAEKAKQDAEAAKSAAATSASQAATSATNAAQSATQAQEAAEGLQEGLETLEGIDGRVTFLETGEGVYKDPATGKVVTFTPLPESDGTIKVIKDLPNFVKVTPMEEDASKTCVATSDGVYYVLGVDDHLYFYDASLNRLGPCWKSNYCRMDWSHFSTSSGRYALWKDEATGHVMCATQDNSNATSGKIYLYDVTAGAVLKSVNKPIKSSYYNNETILNLASGHLLTRHETQKKEDGTSDWFWLLWDTDLNPILAEDGTQKRVDANHVFYKDGEASTGKLFESTPVRVMQMAADNKTLISSINIFDWGDRGGNVGLFTFDENDTCIQIMEVKPVEDPENPGYCQCVKDAEGNIEREWTDDRNCYFPRLVYEELGPATFKKAYPAEYGLSAGGNGNGVSGLPFVSPVWNYFVKGFNSVLRDNCFTYILTRDNKLVNTVFIGNWFAAETSAPKYTYQLPVPNAAQYGKLKWPSGASNIYIFHISTIGNGATGIMLYPVTNSGADYCNVMVRGTVGGDGNNPFVPDREQKATFSPLTFTRYACASASSAASCFFGVPCWFTTVNRAFAGVL